MEPVYKVGTVELDVHIGTELIYLIEGIAGCQNWPGRYKSDASISEKLSDYPAILPFYETNKTLIQANEVIALTHTEVLAILKEMIAYSQYVYDDHCRGDDVSKDLFWPLHSRLAHLTVYVREHYTEDYEIVLDDKMSKSLEILKEELSRLVYDLKGSDDIESFTSRVTLISYCNALLTYIRAAEETGQTTNRRLLILPKVFIDALVSRLRWAHKLLESVEGIFTRLKKLIHLIDELKK